MTAADLQCTDYPMPQSDDDIRLSKLFIDILECDTARISRPCGRLFLIIGTKGRSEGEWVRADPPTYEYKPISFDYVEERCVASGYTEDELIASALEYKRLRGMTMLEYLQEKLEIS